MSVGGEGAKPLNAGNATARQNNLHRALTNVGGVDGDVVGRDKYVVLHGGQQRLRLWHLAPRLVEPVRHAYEEPPDWMDIRKRFAERHTVILRGGEGHGKAAAAIRLLLGIRAETIYALDDTVDMAGLADHIAAEGLRPPESPGSRRQDGLLRPHVGFLLNQPAHFSRLNGRNVQNIEAALIRADARLVLTVGTDAQISDADLRDYVIDLPAPLSYAEVTRRHLSWRLGDHKAGEILALPEVSDYVTEQLARDASCKLAADLALVLSDEFRAGSIDVARVRERVARRGAEELEIWFDGLDGIPARCHAIALAVLNGLPAEDVSCGARSLQRRLDTTTRLLVAPSGNPAHVIRDPFAAPRRSRLEQLRAHAFPGEVRGAYGTVPTEKVEYRDVDTARWVILHAWSGYHIQHHLLDWLEELVDDQADHVRISAGTALGLLATASFDHLCASVLSPWAWSEEDSPARRDAVAYALRVAAEDPALRDSVRAMVRDWYVAEGHPLAEATAARALGVSLGWLDPDRAVEALGRLGVIDDRRVAEAIGASFADLIVDKDDKAAEAKAGTVLRQLLAMLADAQSRAAGQLVFLIVASSLMTDISATSTWPALLFFADRTPGLRGALIQCWRQVVNQELFHAEAEQVLTGWAAQAEEDEELRTALLRMFQAMARGHRRSALILRRYAARWKSREALCPLPRTAAALEAVIAQEIPGGS
ncbi:hypothetical protein [Streptomyces sp. UNOB3_S3]|uniref:hypothetical protein n=1 Tax=Streptomyces sp. UNOB3_S3 TaxID=2871682 RepID=UPI001E507541|nr:hypothetical protein [Streptomyces sp. UNOB3_S3]MCC3777026.1 hypothetical protein [Streptomyces sp. UNOB3_S3]